MQTRDVDVRTDEVVLGIDHTLTLRCADHEFGINRDERRGGVRRIHGHASFRMQDRVLAVAALGCVGVTDVAPGTVTGPTCTIVPTASILRDVATDGALVADLRRGHQFRAFRQHLVLLSDKGMLNYIRERGHRSYLDAVGSGTNSL